MPNRSLELEWSLAMSGECPQPRRHNARRRKWIAIGAFVVLWAMAVSVRWEIRTRWWAWRLVEAQSAESRGYYLTCLTSVAERALGAASYLLNRPAAEHRMYGLAILHRCRGERARALLVRAMSDPDQDVRESAALGLAVHHDQAALPTLLAMLQSKQEPTAVAAAVALERIGGDRATAALIESIQAAAQNDMVVLRAQAIDSLGILGTRQAVPALIDCLTDERPLTTRPAADRRLDQAIQVLGGDLRKHGLDPDAVRDTAPPQTIADLAARALSRITGESFGFRSTDPPHRKAAVARMYLRWWETHKPHG